MTSPNRHSLFALFALFVFGIAFLGVLPTPAVAQQQQKQTTRQPATAATKKIVRRLPPAGMQLEAKQRQQVSELRRRVGALRSQLKSVAGSADYRSDVEVLLKAVDLAAIHNEFYKAGDIKAAAKLLDEAAQRIAMLVQGKAPWAKATGLVVRGYTSNIDGSAQPVGLELPKDRPLDKPGPLLVWLHGRGDKTTDLHFIRQRSQRKGQAQLPGAIVLHPFGRQCVGWKSAGETDVLEAIEFVCSNYAVDRERIILMGFSMGGAGAWHLGAHYTDRWAAVSPGAGFAETRLYNRIGDDALPNKVEQAMWGVYDVPNYVQNLFNIPVVAYSGEVDRQIQAARVMEAAYQKHDRQLTHLIGPKMGHKYHPDTLKEILAQMQAASKRGRPQPREVWLQTQTLRYSDMYWVHAEGLQQHWKNAAVHAECANGQLRVTTENVTFLRLDPPSDWLAFARTEPKQPKRVTIQIDGQSVTGTWQKGAVRLEKADGRWLAARQSSDSLRKRPGLQGPIDDAFLEPFVVVGPAAAATETSAWAQKEFEHFRRRWRALMRGELPIATAADVSDDMIKNRHLVLFGDPQSNPLIKKVLMASGSEAFPFPEDWNRQGMTFAGKKWGATHVPLLICPNPLATGKYVVINSGLTFREGHDRTNSLQNPKLGDWAVVNTQEPPTELAPGEVVAHGVFDELWKFSSQFHE